MDYVDFLDRQKLGGQQKLFGSHASRYDMSIGNVSLITNPLAASCLF